MKKQLLYILLIFSIGKTYAQEKVYKIDFVDRPLLEAVQFLGNQYKVKISYDADLLANYRITIQLNKNSLSSLVDDFFNIIPLESKKVKGIYLILPKKKKRKKTVIGRVVDDLDGSPLAYALVKLDENQGIVTDDQGLFSINLPKDSIMLTFSYLGYQDISLWISSKAKSFQIRMKLDEQELPEFILDGNGAIKEAGFSSVNPDQISTLPSLGETDVFKSLQLLPGVSATDETISGLAIRGGMPDQNLVLLDGFTIYHLDHLFGVFSTFNPNTINHIDVFKGGFNAKYGGRVSAVVDAKAKSWAGEKTTGGININTSSIGGYIQSPIKKKSFLNIGFRRSHFDVIKNPLFDSFIEKTRVDILNASNLNFNEQNLDLSTDFKFYDFNAKWRYAPDDSQLFDFNVYFSEDIYRGVRADITPISVFTIVDRATWSNLGLSTNWSKDWSEKSSSEATISYSKYVGSSLLASGEVFDESINLTRVDLDIVNDQEIVYQSFERGNDISDFSLKWHHKYAIDEQNDLTFGFESNIYNTSYSVFFQEVDTVIRSNAGLHSAFVSNSYQTERLNLTTGLRVNWYSNTNRKFYPEPRVNLTYKLTDRFSLKGSLTFHNQFVNRFSISPFGNSDQFYWVLAEDNNATSRINQINPVTRATHIIWGGNYTSGIWSVDFEAYNKQTNGIVESEFAVSSPLTGLDIDNIDDLITVGSNRTIGLDILLKRNTAKYITWFSYTIANSENSFSILNKGQPFPSNFDQRHEFKWVNTYKVGKLELSSVFVFGSGKPFTPRGELSSEKIILFDVSKFNSERLPAYHRLDLSAKYVTKLGRIQIESGLTLFNVYNRNNVKSRRYSLRLNFDENNEVSSLIAFPVEITLLGFAPNLFLNFKF